MSTEIAKRSAKAARMEESVGTSRGESSSTTGAAASAAAAAAAAASKGFDVIFYPGRHLLVSCYMGEIYIHVREYQMMGEKEYPTKKGACFTPGRLQILRGKIADIDANLNQQEVNA